MGSYGTVSAASISAALAEAAIPEGAVNTLYREIAGLSITPIAVHVILTVLAELGELPVEAILILCKREKEPK